MLPRSRWKIGVVEKLITGKDGKVRGAQVRVPKTKTVLIRPVNKLVLVERIKENKDGLKPNKKVEETITENTAQSTNRPKRSAAVIGEIRRKFAT